MKAKTIFIANNGVRFDTQKEAIAEDLLIVQVDMIMAILNPIEEDADLSFANGDYFVQQDEQSVLSARTNILYLIKTRIDHQWVDQTIADTTVHPSWVSRLLGDYGIQPLNSAWYRFQCIDTKYREWGQPYFAANPEKSHALSNKES